MKDKERIQPLLLGIYLLGMLITILVLILFEFQSFDGKVLNELPEGEFVYLVILGGALGSFIHVTSSFASYMGNKDFILSWIWWYLFKPFIGIGIALIFFFLTRMGGFSIENLDSTSDLYQLVTIATLVGLFNDKAVIKLEEVFNTIFRPVDQRTDKINDQSILLDHTDPKKIPRNGGKVAVFGRRFPADIKIYVNDVEQSCVRISDRKVVVENMSIDVPEEVHSIQLRAHSESQGVKSKVLEIELAD